MGDLRAALIRIAGQVSGRMVRVDIAMGCRGLPSCEKGSRPKELGSCEPEGSQDPAREDRSRRALSGRLRLVRLFGRWVLGATLAGSPAGGGGGACLFS